MSPYQKTYRKLHSNHHAKHGRLIYARIAGIFLLDAIFTILSIGKKIITFTALTVVPFISILLYKTTLRGLIIPLYRLLLSLHRKQKALFSAHKNKLLFLFSNRYISHTVAIIIIIITIMQNFSTRSLRAEDFGKENIFAELNKGQNIILEDVTEEEIIIVENTGDGPSVIEAESVEPPQDERPLAIGQKIVIGQPGDTQPQAALAQGGAAIIKPDLAETTDTPKPRESVITYTVKDNDTIFDIAEEFHITVNTILWANKLSSRSIIRAGDELKILPVSGVEHTVTRGETLGSIASKYSIPQEDIIEVNKLTQVTTIQVGQKIIIPDGRPLYTPPPPTRALVKVPAVETNVVSSENMFWPTTCRRLTQYFRGWRHTGIDIACGLGENVYSAQDGLVERAGWNAGGYGNRIIIKHSDGTKTLYAHLKAGGILVAPGQYVNQGDLIGLMGSTGRSTGPHLHFEVIVSGTRVNPFNYL